MSPRPTIPAQTSLIPINDCVLIQLDHTDKKETKYETRTSGIVVKVPQWLHDNKPLLEMDNIVYEQLEGKHVYFEEYKEGARIKRDGELFCFIKIEDIRGYEDVKKED